MSHTPGPWVVSNDTIGSDHGDIARIHYQSSRAARGWEDRFVIAAAPELLAALKEAAQELSLVCKWFDHPEQTTTETLRRATSAINKAEGRTA
jgi:hypothetical protein